MLEYACVVFSGLPQYLSHNAIERIQKRALAIIFPGAVYLEALLKPNLDTLSDRRFLLCKEFIYNIVGKFVRPFCMA